MSSRAAATVAHYLAAPTRANRDAVIAAHRYLCCRAARKFRRAESDPADLEQVAAIGLIKATDGYRPERKTPFEAYAWLVIVGELMHYVRDHELAIRVPRSLRALERRYVEVWEELAADTGCEPTAGALAEALGVAPSAVHEIRALRRGHRYAPRADDDDPYAVQGCDALPAAEALSLEERVCVLVAVDRLEPRERAIVLGTFAAGLSQAQVARSVGLSQSHVSKLLGRALAKLQPGIGESPATGALSGAERHQGAPSVKRTGDAGFTLIEVMVVVAIIAILAGILIPNFVNARAQAQTSACESNLRSIATALELLYADEQDYGPAGTRDVTPANMKGASGVYYLNNTPKDPAALDQTKNYQVTVTAAANGNPASYAIQCPGTHAGSTLAKLQKNGSTDGSVCGQNCAATTIYYVAGSGIQVQ